ncbi:MAG: DUF6531 domain-containing protein [Pseudomonadota bacterium]
MQLIAKPVTIRSTISQVLLIPPKSSAEPNQSNLYNVGFTSDSAAACSNRIGALCVATSNLINVMTGNTYQQETDFPALPGMMGIEIVRTYNSLQMELGQIGYGWRLSYEIDLTATARDIHITQADGSQLIFSRSIFSHSDYVSKDPSQGHVMAYSDAQGDKYTWFKSDGQQLYFNHLGKLELVTAPTGESTQLIRGPKGELLKVTDPQGRSLIMHYADNSTGFKGIVAIDTPIGQINYQHNNHVKSAGFGNLVQVRYPKVSANASAPLLSRTHHSKIYHYGEVACIDAHMLPANIYHPKIPHADHLLTGSSILWSENASEKVRAKTTRQRTWAYDAFGRGIISVHGSPKQVDKDAKAFANTGLEQIKVSYRVVPLDGENGRSSKNAQAYQRITYNGQIGQTIVTNSAGNKTIYNYTLIAGEYRLLQILGAGCSGCAEPNFIYGYDKLGHQTDVSKVRLTGKMDNKGQAVYQALMTTHTDYDASGRIARISRIEYINGHAQPAQLQVRYAYANTPSFPQIKQASTEPMQGYSQPNLIAKPSVIMGREHKWHIRYNQFGQPIHIVETGYRPALPTDKTYQPMPIQRSTSYTYSLINGRSLLTQIDGALANSKTDTSKNSDITQFHYDQLGQYLKKIIAPPNANTQLEQDKTGIAKVGSDTIGEVSRVAKQDAFQGVVTSLAK